ncbi:MAG: hypothetical protein KatS3mg102_2746 [Planctomycetota bacterium]|nr:MAG: hypothetical protein KatS3mg102_2746 [Planctomycetota bacterium]
MWSALSALALVLAAAAAAPANNGWAFLGYGTKGIGRGGAEVAVADGALAAARNPALLMELPRVRLDGNLLWFLERTRSNSPFGDELIENSEPWPVPALGVAWDPDPAGPPAQTPWLDLGGGSWRLGFNLHQPVALVFAPSAVAAARLGPELSVGCALNVLLALIHLDAGGGITGSGGGEVEYTPRGIVRVFREPDGTPVDPPRPYDAGTGEPVRWAEVFELVTHSPPPPPGLAVDPTPGAELEIRNAFGAGLQAQLGLLWRPRPELALGLAVRSPGIIFSPRGKGTLDLSRAVAAIDANPEAHELLQALVETFVPNAGRRGYKARYRVEADDLILPPVVSLGAAWWPNARWMLALDVRWIGWDMAVDAIDLVARRGDNEDFNEINGGPDAEVRFPLFWRDQFVLALGTSVGLADWLAVRAGYNFGNDPVPARTRSAGPIVIEHHLTFGASVYWQGWDFDLAYVYGLPAQRFVESDGTTFKTELHLFYAGVGYQF